MIPPTDGKNLFSVISVWIIEEDKSRICPDEPFLSFSSMVPKKYFYHTNLKLFIKPVAGRKFIKILLLTSGQSTVLHKLKLQSEDTDTVPNPKVM